MTHQSIHLLLHGEAATPATDSATASLRELSREELFLSLQQTSEESRTARQQAVDQAKSPISA